MTKQNSARYQPNHASMNSHRSYFPARHLFSCLLATCLGLLACPAHSAEKPLNIVLLLADDWRFDTLGVAGNPIVKTPNIDKLAADGVRFTEACVTTPICGVSRSSILSGQWMSRHGNRAFHSMKTPWAQSYPGLLRAHGYHVGHVGKWHSGKFPAKEFDFGRAYSGKHWIKRPDGSRVQSLRARPHTGGLRRLGMSPEAFNAAA